NAFKVEWELFIRHLHEGTPFKWNLLEGAKGVQLVDCALRSWKERRWIDVAKLAGATKPTAKSAGKSVAKRAAKK
ncbi:MAG: hypothetical protein ABIU95_00680, partial [Burkholderiales bacterium]